MRLRLQYIFLGYSSRSWSALNVLFYCEFDTEIFISVCVLLLQASSGWLEKFKKQYGIQYIRIREEKQPNDLVSAENFSNALKEKIGS